MFKHIFVVIKLVLSLNVLRLHQLKFNVNVALLIIRNALKSVNRKYFPTSKHIYFEIQIQYQQYVFLLTATVIIIW